MAVSGIGCIFPLDEPFLSFMLIYIFTCAGFNKPLLKGFVLRIRSIRIALGEECGKIMKRETGTKDENILFS